MHSWFGSKKNIEFDLFDILSFNLKNEQQNAPRT